VSGLDAIFDSPISGFIVALAVGLLIGAERERRRRDPTVGMAGGLRTHVVTALAGALAVQFEGVAVVVVGAIVIGALVVLAYWRDRSADPGLTSEITLFATYLLGAIAPQVPVLAAAIGAVIALLLALRGSLHRFVRHTLSDHEVLDVLLLAAAVLVVLPLLPDQAIDRFGVINPRTIWMLTLLVLLINAAGYLALRTLGPRRGLPVSGFFGGFVSSTATIGALGGRARREPSMLRPAVAAAVLSSVATPLQLLLLLAVLDHELLRRWLLPALLMATVAAVAAAWLLWRSGGASDHVDESLRGRAFQPMEAILFSIIVTTITWCAAWLHALFGEAGALWGIALGGLADAHSAIASAGSLHRTGELATETAAFAVLAALATNTAMKLLAAGITGGHRYALALTPALLAMLAAAALTLSLF
jgi:uncharacterized membrane protein (DUF4010 family)